MKTITRAVLVLSMALLPLFSACSADPTGIASGPEQECVATGTQATCS